MAKQPESDSFLDMFSRFGRDLKVPNVDVEAIISHHRKNLEALEKSARAGAAESAEHVQERVGFRLFRHVSAPRSAVMAFPREQE